MYAETATVSANHPLVIKIDSIRLIRFNHDRASNDELHCDLVTSQIDTAETYYALSYTWGDSRHTRTIYVNSKPLTVRANLWSFLKHARDVFPNNSFWIDAISIDQDDIVERNHQVKLMGRIYSKADKTIVWLGSDSVSINHLFWQILQADTDEDLNSVGTTELKQYIQTAFMLTQFPYWSRMWIVQELLLSNRVQLMYNDDLIDWDVFWDGIEQLLLVSFVRSGQQDKYDIKDSYSARHLEQRRRRLALPPEERHTSLNELLVRYSASQCMLLRDRVVGLLSLLKDGDTFDDCYSGSHANLVLKALLHFGGNFDVLGRLRQSLRITHLQLTEELASWRPSRLRRDYVEAQQYKGEVFACPVGEGFERASSSLICLTCQMEISNISDSFVDRMRLFCLRSLGSRRHLICFIKEASATQSQSYAMFFHNSYRTGNFEINRFKRETEGFLGISRVGDFAAELYIAIDLFVHITEHLRTPEPTIHAGSGAAQTRTKVLPPGAQGSSPRSDARLQILLEQEAASRTHDFCFADLLIPVNSGTEKGHNINE